MTREISNEEEFKSLNEKDLAIAYFGNTGEDFRVFEELAARHQDIPFYHSFDDKLFNLNGKIRVSIFKSGSGKIDYLQPFDDEQLERFIVIHRYFSF